MVQFMIRKHTSTKGDFRSQGLLRKRLLENEFLGSNLVDGPAQRKIPLTGLVLSYSTDRKFNGSFQGRGSYYREGGNSRPPALLGK